MGGRLRAARYGPRASRELVARSSQLGAMCGLPADADEVAADYYLSSVAGSHAGAFLGVLQIAEALVPVPWPIVATEPARLGQHALAAWPHPTGHDRDLGCHLCSLLARKSQSTKPLVHKHLSVTKLLIAEGHPAPSFTYRAFDKHASAKRVDDATGNRIIDTHNGSDRQGVPCGE